MSLVSTELPPVCQARLLEEAYRLSRLPRPRRLPLPLSNRGQGLYPMVEGRRLDPNHGYRVSHHHQVYLIAYFGLW